MKRSAQRIVLTIFNDPNYDQRMIRIAGSLQSAGYDVLLVGAGYRHTPPLQEKPYRQHRIRLLFSTGKARYIEFNIRLFFLLLFTRATLLCAIDLDTIVPVYWISRIKSLPRVYDAHEWFSEMKEVVSRPSIHRIWQWVEKTYVPRFPLGYTVNEAIAAAFRSRYGVSYQVIRNMPAASPTIPARQKEDFLLYQGAVNEGRAFEMLIPAMQWINLPLFIYGDGNFMEQAKALIKQYGVTDNVLLKGKLLPGELQKVTPKARLGFTLFETTGKSNYYSLANRFFDYVQAGVPQICVDFPVYNNLNKAHPVAVLVELAGPEALAQAVNQLLNDPVKYQGLFENCLLMRLEWNWQKESETLIHFYHKILPQ